MGRRISPIIGTLLTVALLVAAGCGPSPVDNPRVLLVGDSILNQSQQQVDTALRQAGWQPVVAGVSGSRIEDWPVLTTRLVAAQHPAIAVVELGTNDCTLGGGCTDLQARIDQLMTTLDSVETVLWLNVQEDVPLTDNARFVNSQLDAAAIRWPKVKIVDFNGDFEDQPDLNQPDQVHPSDAGKAKLAKLIADELDPYFPDN